MNDFNLGDMWRDTNGTAWFVIEVPDYTNSGTPLLLLVSHNGYEYGSVCLPDSFADRFGPVSRTDLESAGTPA